ncbi:MAG: glutamate racemase [Patescibacteria group bacterium]|jgi:glutamate racemase
MNNQPIGICDSGIGGLTVAKEIIKSLPSENIIYLGDTARVPYGVRDKETITKFAKELVKFLINKNVKAIVVACNTISATCLPELQKNSPVPVIGVIKSTVDEVVNKLKSKTIGVIGTRATINSRSYETEIKNLSDKTVIFSQACPLLVPLIEEGFSTHLETKIVAEEYLNFFDDKNIDTLILGCTHYPMIKKLIQEIIGNNIKIIDSTKPATLQLIKVLKTNNLIGNNSHPTRRFFFTDITPQTEKTINIFFEGKLSGKLEKINL